MAGTRPESGARPGDGDRRPRSGWNRPVPAGGRGRDGEGLPGDAGHLPDAAGWRIEPDRARAAEPDSVSVGHHGGWNEKARLAGEEDPGPPGLDQEHLGKAVGGT